MVRFLGVLLAGILLLASVEVSSGQKKAVFNQELANELEKMAQTDQIAAYIPQGEYKKLSAQEWQAFKDQTFRSNQKRAQEIFEKYGFVGFDLAGNKGSTNFWLIVQHSDFDPQFQKRVLEKMKKELAKRNADPGNYGLLVDRVALNTGHQQIYGTQLAYNPDTGQAYPKNLANSATVNKRRKAIGLGPIEKYLNDMSEMHFEMNKKVYLDKGITEPKLYKSWGKPE